VNLLAEGNTFVKLSAPYRISKMQDFSDLEPVATELLKVAGKTHVVFATDWPHTRFEEVDIKSWIEIVFNWCGEDPFLAERLFRGNAEDLWA
jgi:predicted TIM-barrel fold metal-dependent hydrolase